ncbi:hypothetical protein NSA19_08645, partial [Actinomyces bowdenii]|nr:hypothetical protein [Actinomyces bowdenii]
EPPWTTSPHEKPSNASSLLPPLDTKRTHTEEILQKIDDKLPDGAQVILVGYPRLATDNEYILSEWGSTYDAGTGVRGLSDAARTVQSELVNN